MKPKDKAHYIPMGVAEKKSRLERFADLNRWVTARGGWIVSLPGADPVVVECLPEMSLASELRDAGYELTPAGEGERIIPSRIVQKLAMRSDGTYEQLAAGSTRPVALTAIHSGITAVLRYSFSVR
ncbi:hypothetical protein HL666_14855 [Bradyrhizobium sp. 83002]|uniref:hypothetical protein n=1 Tax=Bradyrhizobium aeschynomenes TaxID=2734909 RepID=UPI0015555D95|nr:hypothetical protein [Bradyrhizobium aeschynomenes]NPU12049.1 hypothetical protein [Bradyrhizobium aeschynomenes]